MRSARKRTQQLDTLSANVLEDRGCAVGTKHSASGGGLTRVAMMQTTDQGEFRDLTLVGRFDGARLRTILVQRAMWAMAVIVL